MKHGEKLLEILKGKANPSPVAHKAGGVNSAPKGWEAGLTLDGNSGELTSRPVPDGAPRPGWEDEFRARGGDPDLWEPTTMRYSSWDAQKAGGEIVQMQAFRWNLRPKTAAPTIVVREYVEALRTRGPLTAASKDTPAERTLVVPIADTQIGKDTKRGGGPERFVDQWDDYIGHVEDRVADTGATRILAPGMGDTTEGCNSNYPSQRFTTSLNEADQIELGVWAIDRAFDRWAKQVGQLWSPTVSSNHDAKREGKGYPHGRSDCRAFTIWRTIAYGFGKNPDRYGHCRIWLPDDPDVATVDLHGHGLAMIHGDLPSKGGSDPSQKMWRWWQGQTHGNNPQVNGDGRLPAGDCTILLTAHYHHYWSKRQNGKVMFGCPALDVVGSQWWTDLTGIWSKPGLLTFVVDANGVSQPEVFHGG